MIYTYISIYVNRQREKETHTYVRTRSDIDVNVKVSMNVHTKEYINKYKDMYINGQSHVSTYKWSYKDANKCKCRADFINDSQTGGFRASGYLAKSQSPSPTVDSGHMPHCATRGPRPSSGMNMCCMFKDGLARVNGTWGASATPQECRIFRGSGTAWSVGRNSQPGDVYI